MSTSGKTYKLINRMVGKALHDYGMIQEDDRIAVGVSGGKDSWALLFFLLEFQKKAPIHFSLEAIYIDPGFEPGADPIIQVQAHELGVAVRIEHTDFGVVAHSAVNRENPCFYCAKQRRRRLFEVAAELGCNKLAFGHNQDDLIETLFLNIFYSGMIASMVPYQPFFGGRLTVIRPLAYVNEDSLRQFAAHMQWPVVENPCPSAKRSKRAEIKAMLAKLYNLNPNIRGNIFRAMRHVKSDYLLKP